MCINFSNIFVNYRFQEDEDSFNTMCVVIGFPLGDMSYMGGTYLSYLHLIFRFPLDDC